MKEQVHISDLRPGDLVLDETLLDGELSVRYCVFIGRKFSPATHAMKWRVTLLIGNDVHVVDLRMLTSVVRIS